MDAIEALQFLFMLGSLELGRVSSSSLLSSRLRAERSRHVEPVLFDGELNTDPARDARGPQRHRLCLPSNSTLAPRHHHPIHVRLSFSLPFSPSLFLSSLAQKSSKRFWPTRLATSLSAGSTTTSSTSASSAATMVAQPSNDQNAASSEEQKGFIIIETNFRVYAYTSLSLALLPLPMLPISKG